MRQAVIFDIDGTLADISPRLKFIQGKKKDWKTFYEFMGLDTPIRSVCHLCATYVGMRKTPIFALYTEVYFVTGRPEKYRDRTIQWLRETFPDLRDMGFDDGGLHSVHLIMRKNGDHRQDDVVKQEVLENIRKDDVEVLFAVEDRKRVVDMYRRNGVTCLQCAEGDF